jgi:hypothetical protein
MFFGGDPFDHFGHGGGRSSHRASRGGGGGAAADTTKLYETLGVSFEKKFSCFTTLFSNSQNHAVPYRKY